MQRRFQILIMAIFFTSSSFAADYDFSWTSGRDMAGAMMICAPFGMKPGECPWVAVRCNLPPLLYLRCNWDGCDWKSKCYRRPKFGMSPLEVKEAQCHARAQAGLPAC